MQIEPYLVLGTAIASQKTRLSFLFKDLDGAIVALSSSWLVTACKSARIDIKGGNQTIGTGEIAVLEPATDVLGPHHCGFVFRVNRRCRIAAAFALGGETLPACSIGEAIERDVFLGDNSAVCVGTVLPYYDEATLTIFGTRQTVFPLLAVTCEGIAGLRKRYDILNGAMLYDKDHFLIGLIVGLVGSTLLVASVVEIMERFNLSFLYPEEIAEWNRQAVQHRTSSEAEVFQGSREPSERRFLIPNSSALDRLQRSATT